MGTIWGIRGDNPAISHQVAPVTDLILMEERLSILRDTPGEPHETEQYASVVAWQTLCIFDHYKHHITPKGEDAT